MHEEILKQFFKGEVTTKELSCDLAGSLRQVAPLTTEHSIIDMAEDFEVKPEHLVKVCDAVLTGELEPDCLNAIGFCIVASDHFNYDTDTKQGELVSETVMDWSAPEVNYPLTVENVRRFRKRLVTGKDTFR